MQLLLAALAALSVWWIYVEFTRTPRRTSAFRDLDGYVDTPTALTQNEAAVRTLAKTRVVRQMADKSKQKNAELLERYGNPEQLNPTQFWAQKALYAIVFGGSGAIIGYIVAQTAVPGDLMSAAMLILGSGFGIGFLGPYWVVQRLKKRSETASRAVDAYLFELMELVAAFMGDGGTPAREAIIRAAPYLTNPYLSDEVTRVSTDLAAGVPFAEAMIRMRERVGTINVVSFTNKMIVASVEGSLSAEELIADARSLRSDRVTKIKDRAQTTQTVSLIVILMGFGFTATVAFFWPVIQELITGAGI